MALINSLRKYDDLFSILNRPSFAERHLFSFPLDNTKFYNNFSFDVDMEENDNAFIIKADLPGISKDEIDVSIDNGIISISAERHISNVKNDNKNKFHLTERFSGSFSRKISLPKNVSYDDISADYTNGVLTLTINKSDNLSTRKIKIT